jgi:hypothetical protein
VRGAAAQSIGRIILVAFVLIALLAILTTARYASTRLVRRTAATQTATRPVKGDVRRSEDGKLQYFDGRQWTGTPPPPNDNAF